MSSNNVMLPRVRNEGKSHNIKIQLKPSTGSTKKAISTLPSSKKKMTFPKMTIKPAKVHSPFELVVESQEVSPPPFQQPSKVCPAAFVTDGSSPMSRKSTVPDQDETQMSEDEEESADDGDGGSEEGESEEERNLDDEDDDDDEENTENAQSAVPSGSIHTKYPDDFVVPDPYGIKEADIPKVLPRPKTATVAPVMSSVAIPPTAGTVVPSIGGEAQSYASMSVTKQKAIKEYLLSKLEIVIPEEERAQALASYSTKNTCDELQDAFNHYKAKRAIARSIQDSRQMVNMTMTALETGMVSQKVVDLSLMEGCSQNTALMVDGGEFDDILVELTGGTFANYHPLTRLTLSIGFGLFAYYGAQKMTRQVTQKPFQHPMAQFMTPPNPNGPMPPSGGGYPMPWPYMQGGPNTSQAPPQPQFPQQYTSVPQPPHMNSHYHHDVDSSQAMQQRVQAQEAARQEQSRAEMLRAETPFKRKRASPSHMRISTPPVAATISPIHTVSTVMDSAAQRYTADRIEDYHHNSKKARLCTVTPSEDGDSACHDNSNSEGTHSSAEDSELESTSTSSRGSPSKTPTLERPKNEKEKPAAILTSSTLQAKIDKAIAMNKKENENRGFGGFAPLRKQTVQGPPSPMHPRAGANLTMAPPVQPVSSLASLAK